MRFISATRFGQSRSVIAVNFKPTPPLGIRCCTTASILICPSRTRKSSLAFSPTGLGVGVERNSPPRSGRKHGKHHPSHHISNRPHRPLSRLEKQFFWNSLFLPARLPCGSPQALQIWLEEKRHPCHVAVAGTGVGALHTQCQEVVFCGEGLLALAGSRLGRKAVRMPIAGRYEQR